MSAPTPRLRLLIDLTQPDSRPVTATASAGAFRMLARLAKNKSIQLEFVYLIDPPREQEVAHWLRGVDRVVNVDLLEPALAAREKCQLVFSPFGLSYWSCPGIPTISTVSDLRALTFPESMDPVEGQLRTALLRRMIEQSDLLFVFSVQTSRGLEKHFGPTLPPSVRLVWPVEPSVESQAAIAPGRSFLYPADAEIQNNHATLLTAYAIYAHVAGAAAWRLALAGERDAAMTHVAEIASRLALANHVDFIAPIAGTWSDELVAQTGAVIFPALADETGAVLIEALARRIPILASDSEGNQAVTGGAALHVPGRSPLALAHAMEQIATDPELRQVLAEKGRSRSEILSRETDYDKIAQTLHHVASGLSRRQYLGYHPRDGFTDRTAIFAVPPSPAPLRLSLATHSLDAPRTLELRADAECLQTIALPAGEVARCEISLPSGTRVVCLQVPDATRLSDADPRTQGVRLAHLRLTAPSGQVVDLLPPPPP